MSYRSTPSASLPRLNDRSGSWATRIDIGLVLLTAGAISLAALRIFPVWTDDAVISQLIGQGNSLSEYHRDRPLVGWLWQFLNERGLFFSAVGVCHWISWSSLALGAMWTWRLLFSRQQRFGLAVACLVLSPVLCEAQWVLVNFPLGGVFGSALATIALGLALASFGSALAWRPRLALAAGLVFLGGQFSEYSVPATVAAAVILVLHPWWNSAPRAALRRGIVAAGVLTLAAVLSYALYHALGDPSARQRVRPELLLTNSIAWRLKILLPRLVSQFWLSTVGALGGFLGRVRFDSLPALGAAAVGAVTALVVVIRVRAQSVPGPAAKPNSAADVGPREASFGNLPIVLAALLCGLLPMVVMGAISEGRSSSRYLLPVLPMASCATVAILMQVLNRRWWWLIPTLAGFAVGCGQTTEFLWARQDEQKLAKWSAEIRQNLAPDGLTVAVFGSHWAHSDLVSGAFELTYWLTSGSGWTEDQRERFWALSSLESSHTDKGTVELFSDRPRLDLQIRGVGRSGPISRILWLRTENDSLIIEPTPPAPAARADEHRP